jgi:multidrug resistance protein
MPIALFALAISTFAIGTTEFVIVGLIPEMARDLAVSLPTAGLLVSLYALSITVGGPTFSALTGRFERRPLIIGLMVVFTLSNLAAAFAPNYATLLAARMVMGVSHGVFFGVGAAVAMSLVDRSRAGSAVAVMMGGLTIAMVIGVPLGSWVGQAFGWRTPFLAVTALGGLSLLGLAVMLPPSIAHVPPESFLSQLALLGNKRLARLYLLTAVSFGGTFVVFTFLSPMMTHVTGVSESTVSWALMVFGGATVAGNYLGGRLADSLGTKKALGTVLTGLIVSVLLLLVTVHHQVPLFINLVAWGVFAFAIPPIMQSAVVTAAEVEAPNAIGTASVFNIAAFNLGISGGSFIGGKLVAGPGLLATPWAAAALAMIALALVALTMQSKSMSSFVGEAA